MTGWSRALLACVAVLAAGCTRLPGDFYATDLDVRRAEKVWADPWVAPTSSRVPGAWWGSNGWVDREVAHRETIHTGATARTAVLQEVATATAQGWTLVGVTCRPRTVRAVVTRGGTDLDAAAAAEVTARAAQGSGRGRVLVDLVAVVPHHLDDDWPELGTPVSARRTCLAGGEGSTAPPLPEGPPRGEVDEDVAIPVWTDEGPDETEQARLDALTADPWFASLRQPVPPLATGEGTRDRNAPRVSGVLGRLPSRPAAAVAAVVAEMDAWRLTYAACSPGTGVVATLRLATEAGPVVARLLTRAGRRVWWTVGMPVVGSPGHGWVDAVPTLSAPACLDVPTPRHPVVEGTPVSVPGSQHPMQ